MLNTKTTVIKPAEYCLTRYMIRLCITGTFLPYIFCWLYYDVYKCDHRQLVDCVAYYISQQELFIQERSAVTLTLLNGVTSKKESGKLLI